MEKFQQKVLDIMGPFSRLRKSLEDIKRAPNDTVAVPTAEHIRLVEQTVLLIGPASNLISYSRRLNVLKFLINTPRKLR